MTELFEHTHPALIALFYVVVLLRTMVMERMQLLILSFVMAFVFLILVKGFAQAVKSFLFALVLIGILSVTNPLFAKQGTKILFTIGKIKFTAESMQYGLKAGIMIAAVLLWCETLGMLMTTERFMQLAGKRFPKLALVLSMTVRFIPRMKKQYEKIHGLRRMMNCADEMSKMAKIRNTAAELDALMSWSFENAIETADSMEAREYGERKRTNYETCCFRSRDIKGLIVIVVVGSLSFFLQSMTVMLLALPIFVAVKEKIEWNYLKSGI